MEYDPTREKVVRALNTLLDDTPLQKITVGKISAEAGVSRQTFYYHFDNVFGIYKWVVKSRMDTRRLFRNDPPSLLRTVDGLYRSLEKNRKLTLAFAGTPYFMDIIQFIKEELTPSVRETLQYRAPYEMTPRELTICTDFVVGANVNLYANWIHNSMETPVDEIYHAVERLMKSVFEPSVVQAILDTQQAPVFHASD